MNLNIEKSRIALIQLRSAIQLFNSKDFISALTLAGAADEIFGQFATRRKGYNTLDQDKNFWDGISEILKKDKPSKDKIKQVNNKIKNSLKHQDSAEDLIVNADFEFEANCIIDNAIKNFWLTFDKPPKDRIINNYVNKYWT